MVAQQIGANFFVSTAEELPYILVPSAELSPQLPSNRSGFILRQGHDVGANLAGALTGHEMKRPEQDTFAVR